MCKCPGKISPAKYRIFVPATANYRKNLPQITAKYRKFPRDYRKIPQKYREIPQNYRSYRNYREDILPGKNLINIQGENNSM
jgi:hypothetical protein